MVLFNPFSTAVLGNQSISLVDLLVSDRHRLGSRERGEAADSVSDAVQIIKTRVTEFLGLCHRALMVDRAFPRRLRAERHESKIESHF
jgi:hypothetical protein